MRSARILVPLTALVLAAAAAVTLARVAVAGDRPCRHDSRDCKGGDAQNAAKPTTTTASKTTSTPTSPKQKRQATAPAAHAKASAAQPAPSKTGKKGGQTKPAAHAATTTHKGKPAKPAAPAAAAGSVSLVDKPFVCSGPVHLASVTVTIRNVSSDAVLLRSGCTGSIGRINVVQYHGDGIKVGNARNLVVGGGSVRCYGHDAGKHQDGVQVLGGQNVTFVGLDVGCYSANNSQVWINDGTGNGPGGTPTNIVFDGGRFQGYFNHGQYGPGGAYGVAIVGSLRSGIRNATICPNAHPSHALYVAGSAQAPVTSGTTVAHAC